LPACTFVRPAGGSSRNPTARRAARSTSWRAGATQSPSEVKARRTRDAAILAIDGAKQRRISRAARHWLARNAAHHACNFRGDAILMTPWRLPERVEGAYALDLGNA